MHKTIKEEAEQFFGDLTLYYPKKNVVVLVEDREDIAFWKHIFEEYAPRIKPDFPLLSASGKSTLKKYTEFACKEFLICVDSDNDSFYNTNNTKWLSNKNPFIYQTHTHSRENYFILAHNLQRLAESLELEYDFDSDFKQISEILYDWLIDWLYFNDIDRHWLRKEIDDFAKIVSWEELENIIKESYKKEGFKSINNLDKLMDITTTFKVLILEHTVYLDKLMQENGYDYLLAERNEFKNVCSIEPHETLHYIQGHIAFEDIILPYFTKIIQILALNMAEKQATPEKRNHYLNRSKNDDYSDLLKTSYKDCFSRFVKCKFMKQIEQDINRDFPS